MAKAVNKLEPTILVIFGITGDLSKRYLLPALYHLCKDGLLPEQFVVVGTSRQQLRLDDFLEQVELCVLEQDNVCDPAVLHKLRSLMRLHQLDPTDGKDYDQLLATMNSTEDEFGVCMNRLYYLSIPPQIYPAVVRHLGEHGLQGSCPHNVAKSRLIVEKPFGYDLDSAKELLEQTAAHFREEQVYRIDHYLAKETVQDILLFRSRNPELEKIWNSKHIASIEIVAYEEIGIEGRKFYDNIGALRDIIQSHLLQLLALTLMELPDKLTSRDVHAHKEAFLELVKPLENTAVGKQTIRAQYEGYRQEVGNDASQTETFAAIHCEVPTSRWQGTTISLATGKAMNAKQTAITVNFRDGSAVCFRVQPQPAIELQDGLSAVTDFSDSAHPVSHAQADAYEQVLIEAIQGNQTLFASAKEVLACWRIIQPVLDEWAKGTPPLKSYPKGNEAATLLGSF